MHRDCIERVGKLQKERKVEVKACRGEGPEAKFIVPEWGI